MRLGVIGGMGPAATALFMELVTKVTDAKDDRGHLEMLIFSVPSVADRTEYILDNTKENPVPKMTEAGKLLKREGVDVIAIPCITAHSFHDKLQSDIGLPIIHGVRCTAKYLSAEKVKKAGIMATDGTLKVKLFEKELADEGIEAVKLSENGQKKVMSLIYDDIKANRSPDESKVEEILAEFKEKGVERIILGCTELSVMKKYIELSDIFVDAMEVLAVNSVKMCGKDVSEEYRHLVV